LRFEDYHPSEIPPKPGVYVYRDRFGKVIYVGKASNLRRRMSSYFQPSRIARADAKLRSLIHSIEDFSYEVVRTEDEALILESQLIKSYAPHYNILMRDDKRYLLLKLDHSEKYPTLKLARLRKNDNAEYFGPFPKGSALRMTLEFLLAHFGLRACRDSEPDEETRKRCLKRIVHDCCAPCTGNVTHEEYLARVEQTLAVLNGDLADVTAAVKEKMLKAAGEQKFEKAAHYRDVLTNLETVFKHKSRTFERSFLPGGGSGRESVAALAKALALQTPPRHIIGFDISNILGKLAVASLVDFKDGKPDRDSYRRFRIKTVHQSNDFAMMHEVVSRHFSRLLAENRPLPDLVMVDGGKGQLSSAIDALIKVGCPPLPIIGLAEKNEEIYVPGRSEPVVLSRHNPALQMLQALRDEAHRFAISYHRSLRSKRLRYSELDGIQGIGPKRKQELLKTFKSLTAIGNATLPELERLLPKDAAAAVYHHFHSEERKA
jgi:excinuclease ABC subunit C